MATRTLEVDFQCEAASIVKVLAFRMNHRLGHPAEATITVQLHDYLDPEAAIGVPARLSLASGDGPESLFAGIVESITVVGSTSMGDGVVHRYAFHVVSQMALLDRAVGCQIFQDMTVKEIVAKVLLQNNIPAGRQDFRLTASYPKREYCVQYNESALAFVSRLLEEEGIYYFAETTADADDGDVIVFVDDSSNGAAPLEGGAEIPFRMRTGLEQGNDAIYAILERQRITSGKFVLRDFDFKRPKLDLTATAEGSLDTDLEVFDYPGHYVEPAEGKRLAQVRLEAATAARGTLSVEADCTRLAAGRKLKLTDALSDELNGEYVITSLSQELRAVKAGTPTYLAKAELLPVAVKFRSPRVTPVPIIDGPQTATVVAPKGAQTEEIHTDEHGRCKVKFHWDLGPDEDDKASCWMRVQQLQTSGSMMLPRIGWEVIVEFLEGDPDRPLVTGKLYNGLFMPPYALPAGATRTSIQTASTPGGAGKNELRFEDKAGGEEIMVHAQYDQKVVAANNKTVNVGNCETRMVKVDSKLTVGGREDVKIKMGSQTSVGGNQTISVGGNRTAQVNAVTATNVGGSSTTTVGGNHFEMDGNPIKALIAIAVEKATEVLEKKAAAELDKIDKKVSDKVNQVMGPVKKLEKQADEIGKAMQALQSGDVSALPGLMGAVGGLPSAEGFAGALGGGGGGEEGGGAGEAKDGEAKGGEKGGEGGAADHITRQLGIDQAVNGAIEKGLQTGGDALGDALSKALGLDSEGAGGSSAANKDGPNALVDGVDATDRAKGPGHATALIGGSYTEKVGTLKVTASINGVALNIAGAMTQNIGAAKVTMALGDIAEQTGGDKTEKALGLVVVSRADESETVGGAKTVMVGGLVYEKIAKDHTIEAQAPAMFIGAFHKIEAGTKITLKCGGSEVVIDGSGVSMKAPLVTITAAKIQFTKGVAEL